MWVGFKIASAFNSKVKMGIEGRANLFERLEHDIGKLNSAKRIWFHSSSMGEFEQAKPIIASIKKKYKNVNIIVTFFSPSGYEHSKNYKLADVITYIPFDSRKNARLFVEKISPSVAVFVRYDVWPNHLWALREKSIPALIANATIRNTSGRFLPLVKNFHSYIFNNFDSILTVSSKDEEIFQSFVLKRVNIKSIGDTRYDQVWIRSQEAKRKKLIPERVLKGKKVLVTGSTWREDEEILIPAIAKLLRYEPNLLTIIVPHEPTLETIENIEMQFNGKFRYIRFSGLNNYKGEKIVIVDSVGILMFLYQYADVAYIGGGFRQGVHNVLEPAVYGIPVLYGPKHLNSNEAVEFVKSGCGFVVNNQLECYKILRSLLDNERMRSEAGNRALKIIKDNIGATDRFISYLDKYI